MQILFACDLDNTLIHSVRHRQEGDVCVEWLDGKEQSFMTPHAIALLQAVCRLEQVTFLPVTTRSTAQFLRIQFPEGCVPEQALVCNGLQLLHHGEPDAVWKAASLRRTEDARPELERMQALCAEDARFTNLRMVDDLFLFACCADAPTAKTCIAEYAEQTDLTVQGAGRKLYFLPGNADKGTMLQLYAAQHTPRHVIAAAGDSEMDLPMLNKAAHAIVPFSLAQKAPAGFPPPAAAMTYVCGEQRDFTEQLLEQILQIAAGDAVSTTAP